MSSFHEWILVVGTISCYDKMMMKEMKKESLLGDTFVAAKSKLILEEKIKRH